MKVLFRVFWISFVFFDLENFFEVGVFFFRKFLYFGFLKSVLFIVLNLL